ncbi:MAG: FAD-binding protein [Raoultibacter sp.]
MSQEFSRRNFLKGATLTALSAGTLGAMIGCSPKAGGSSSDANTAVAAQTSATDWLGNAPKIEESKITETIETEVLVVGCGTAGWPACISAAENGAKVLVIERLEEPSGPKEDIGAIDSALQKASFEQFPEFKIDKMEAMHDIVRYANGFINYDLVKLWADESGATVDWITDIISKDGKMKMNFEGGIGTIDPKSAERAWATGHSPASLVDDKAVTFLSQFQKYADTLGVQFRCKTELVCLEQDETGRVGGIIARDVASGNYLRIKASNGVIVATGGYSSSPEMMAALQPEILKSRIACSKGSPDTGEGIKAALWLGAQKDPIGTSILFNRACCKPDATAGDGTVGEWFWFGEQPFLKLNLKGERFCNESGPYDYMLHSAHMQPMHTYIDVWDANYAEQVKQMNEVGCCRLFPFDNGAPNNIPLKVVEGMNAKLLEQGYIQQADTIEELAEKLNIPAEAAAASVARYNENAAAGIDADYGKESYRLLALNTPPYYGVRTGAWHLATFDGIQINSNMHPVKEDGTVIDGLYMVGDCSGGFFCLSYPNLFTGLACGRSMTFGLHAGKLAATKTA